MTNNRQQLGQSELYAFPIAYGMWRFAGTDVKTAQAKIEAALESGINLFDQADIYGVDGGGSFGDSELLFGKVLAANPSLREKMIIATKGGIVLGVPYDSSGRYLEQAIEKSLQRMQIDCIDLYQIHRPDFLGNPQEIAAVLTKMREQGKIREVGLSNYLPSQIRALQAYLPFPIATQQPEFSCWQHAPLRDGIMDLCMENKMTPLAWSPLAGGRLVMSLEDAKKQPDPRLAALVHKLQEVADVHGVSRTVVALSWLLRHPAGVIPIIGTQRVERIQDSIKSVELELSRPEWNSILVAAQGYSLP